MKKLLILIAIMLFSSIALAAKPNVIVVHNYCVNGSGGPFFDSCPSIHMWNRTKTKVIARYTPTMRKSCTSGSMSQWRIGHPNNAYGIGFTAEDWQDLEVAKTKTKGNWRWGDCCPGGEAYNVICLR